ncbi:hypothetical protein GCM10010497_59090 [Streptomyces cinereoruber]|uniref:AbiTii domain-containing protein n=1 Tax=Streptomyces cinereoruber TaxID=67260 RepID=A0AAV4KT00_9ACTN|nr:hypothetical protein [Streptomyces cinereoruber]MBB4161741.1 hypothetical protein [Streptomyces cinereoruber]MBY8820057.1 hypothetical protein [Streptomyces cinereoruber]NIH65426.1 hypothetical protein [Streptomyces cinereoruber]GGR47905.1 hypothetical protein GCM10010497_59090 [Streptomyces cinereoruber]
MNRRQRGLLAEIEQEALDESKPLSSVLRKCVVLGGHSSSAELREWATRELRGYDGVATDALPGYRRLPAPIQVNALLGPNSVRGQRINTSELPEFARNEVREEVALRNGIGEVEALAQRCETSGEHAHLGIPGGLELTRLMDAASGNPFQRITDIYWSVSPAALRGLADQVRTTVVELVAELRAAMPDDQQIPTPDQMEHALHVVVHGDRARVNVNAAQTSGSGSSNVGQAAADEDPFWSHGRRIGAAVVGLATLIGTGAALWPLLGK